MQSSALERILSRFGEPGRNWAIGIVLAVVTLLVYQPAWNGRPLWDDDQHLIQPELQSISGLGPIWLKPGATQQYYPLTYTVFWVENRLWGKNFAGYHFVNILFHVLSALLLFRILRKLAIPGAWLHGT